MIYRLLLKSICFDLVDIGIIYAASGNVPPKFCEQQFIKLSSYGSNLDFKGVIWENLISEKQAHDWIQEFLIELEPLKTQKYFDILYRDYSIRFDQAKQEVDKQLQLTAEVEQLKQELAGARKLIADLKARNTTDNSTGQVAEKATSEILNLTPRRDSNAELLTTSRSKTIFQPVPDVVVGSTTSSTIQSPNSTTVSSVGRTLTN